MSLSILIGVGLLISLAFHFVGVYTESKKTVWIMLLFVWSAVIGTAVNEIKPDGYKNIEKMKGKFTQTDKLIEESMPEISLYEMLVIKKSYYDSQAKAELKH